jgi:CheY-like chemotaxis protein/drug/metabolite transporter (DMT)-like permease
VVNSGSILVVDDSRTVRLKLAKAVEALGHRCVAVDSGRAALDQIARETFDVILLDIVMPEMDGFEVLKVLKSARETRDLPVIVISALDEDMTSVVQAIELGAEDFLPKDFEPALLRARVSTCIEKKRLRDIEKEYLRQVSKLTRAATALEIGHFNPTKLGIQEVAARTDGLGRLANVFSTMAQKVYERERKMRQNIRTFRGSLLLLAVGALLGLIVPLSKMASNVVDHPLGLAVVTNLLGGVICLGIVASRGKLPKPSSLGKSDWTFIVGYTLISGVIGTVLVFWIAGKLPAFILSIFVILEGFAVFLFAAVMKIEAPRLKRFFGLALGLVGVAIVMFFGEFTGGSGEWIWMLAGLTVPISFATDDLFIAEKYPKGLDTVVAAGMVHLLSSIVLTPVAFAFHDFIPVELLFGQMGLIAILISIATVFSMILFVSLTATTGAVFASQNAYAVTAAGIAWSMILLGENIPMWTWAALCLIVVGLILVEPKQEAEEEPPVFADGIEDLPI